jgi:hypothetical protein
MNGVWIPYERALQLANEEGITEDMYPLFVHDIETLLRDAYTLQKMLSHCRQQF